MRGLGFVQFRVQAYGLIATSVRWPFGLQRIVCKWICGCFWRGPEVQPYFMRIRDKGAGLTGADRNMSC